jgi:hypothetical protein
MMDRIRRLAVWQIGLLMIACGAFLFAEQHWLSGRHKSYLTMLPMVSVEELGVFAVALGVLVTVVGLVRGRSNAKMGA